MRWEHRHTPSVALADEIPWLKLASRGARWLVGVSGGADSVALLHLLHCAGFRNLVVCHLNHQLRGRASDADARFVSRLAEKLGLPCEVGTTDVRSRMKQHAESMETAARNARHEFFAECAVKYRCRRVILAHHADDQAETVLWNLLRGSRGMKGMRGEQEISVAGRKLDIFRPLLGVRHAELVDWLKSGGHKWREDASNSQPVAVRNRLRNEIFPLLAEISGRDAVEAFTRGAADTFDLEGLETHALEQANVLDPQGRLHLPAMRKVPSVLQLSALRKYLMDAGVPSIDRALLERAVELLEPTGPAVVNLPGGRRLRRREGRLWIDG